MSKWDIRSIFSRTRRTIARRSATSELRRTAGKASLVRHGVMENLEPRVLLAGDHPSLVDLPGGTEIFFDGDGRGVDTGVIETAGSNDLFKFTAPATDFVRILADTRNVAGGSSLNTRVRLYNSDGQLLRSSSGNGVLTAGTPTDAWLGFVATAGETYFIEVLSDASSGSSATGQYILRVNAASTDLDISETGRAMPVGSDPSAPDPVEGLIGQDDLNNPGNEFAEDDVVFRITTPDDETFNSVAAATLRTPLDSDNKIDPRIDIYDEVGNLVTFDSQRAYLTDAFAFFKVEPGATYYVRVRSDEFTNPATRPSAGEFELRLQLTAIDIGIDPVTRRGMNDENTLEDENEFEVFRFVSEGAELGFVTGVATAPAPHDLQLWLIGEQGNLISFVDDFNGTTPEVQFPLTAGATYYVIASGFDDILQNANPLIPFDTFTVFVEASHTFNPSPNEPGTNPPVRTDDHIDTPGTGLTPEQRRRALQDASPIRWSDPILPTDENNNPVLDRSPKLVGSVTGRIHRSTDSDVYQLVLPADMLGQYAGDNDDVGSALFVGGAFDGASKSDAVPVTSRNLAIWDAGSWWFVGNQGNPDDGADQLGFLDNPNTPDTNGPEIYALQTIDIGGGQPGLVVGGDFILNVPGPDGPVPLQNLAVWFFDPLAGVYTWGSLGDVNGPVRTVASFDADGYDSNGDEDGGELEDPIDPDDPDRSWLVIGGEFTGIGDLANPTPVQNLAAIDVIGGGGWFDIGGVVNLTGTVYALQVFDPEDPGSGREFQAGPPPVTEVPDPPDHPNTLFIGGDFTSDVGNNFIAFNGFFVHPGNFGSFPGAADGDSGGVLPNINGPVYAMTVWDQRDPEGGSDEEIPPRLIVAGDFTSAGGVTVSNIAAFGLVDPDAGEPDDANYSPQLIWEDLGGGLSDVVRAVAVWTPAEVAGGSEPFDGETPLLIAGGDFEAEGFLSGFDGDAWDTDLAGGGVDGPVHALRAMTEAQDPAVPVITDAGGNVLVDAPREVMYVGGAFTGGLAYIDYNPTLLVPAVFSTLEGVFGIEDGPNDPATVFAIAEFDDHNRTFDNAASQWDRNDRASARVSITVSGANGAFNQMFIRVYDSGFNLIYSNDTIAPPFPDPAGAIDPSGAPGTNQAFVLPPMWGGEVYYIEVTSLTSTGRYNMTVTTDAAPLDDDDNNDGEVDGEVETGGDGIYRDTNTTWSEVPDADKFGFPPEFWKYTVIDAAGDAETLAGIALTQIPDIHLRLHRTTGTGVSILQAGDQSIISHINDSDVYVFTAANTGVAEFAVQTIGVADQYLELQNNVPVTDENFIKTYDSPLDSIIRVYNQDLKQIAYNDNGEWVLGDTQTQFVGTFPGVTFTERDARVTFKVNEGENYYVIVESGQKYADGSAEDPADRILKQDINATDGDAEIDWRHAIGSYVLLFNTPSTDATDNGGPVFDDHHDIAATESTMIPIGPDGSGTLDLFVNNRGTPLDPEDDFFYAGTMDRANDVDLFGFVALASGTASLTVNRVPTNNTLLPVVNVFAANGDLVASGSATAGSGSVTLNFPVSKADRYTVVVSSGGGTLGQYQLRLNTPAIVDDAADRLKIEDASEITLVDFLGSGVIQGSLEEQGDVDVYKFQALDYQTIRVDLTGSVGFNGQLVVYEVQEDNQGLPYLARLAANDDLNANTTNARVLLHVNPSRISGPGGNDTGNEYKYYYIVVSGSDPEFDRGNYTLSLSFDPLDDHADVAEYNDADTRDLLTEISLDSSSGLGDQAGLIEIASDSDAFYFQAAATGPAEVRITLADGSTLDAEATIFDEDGNTVASGPIGTFTFDVIRQGLYYVIVSPNGAALPENQVGGFEIEVEAPPIDDHANIDEFDLATGLVLDNSTGDAIVGDGLVGGANPTLAPRLDTDLYTFTTIEDGPTEITVTPVGAGSLLQPVITVYDSSRNIVTTTTAAAPGASVTLDLGTTVAGSKFYVLVSDAALPNGPDEAGYVLFIDSEDGIGDPDPDPSEIDFTSAVPISLNSQGDGSVTDDIEVAGDRDVFKFVAPSSGRAFIQIVTPTGSVLDAQVTVLNAANESAVVVTDSNGIPGATANASFDAVGGTTYYIIADGIAASTGSYTVRIDVVGADIVTEIPDIDDLGYNYRIFYPEGFANNRIKEYVSIANPNDFAVRYTLILRYQGGERDAVVQRDVLLPAGARGGATLSNGTAGRGNNVRANAPYAIEIVSSGPLGATLSHYDFDASTGDAFTSQTEDTWTFARVERSPGLVNDFVVFFNPNPFAVVVTMTATTAQGAKVEVVQEVPALRRGGFDINSLSQLPTGIFGVTLTSRAKFAAHQAAFEGIVASLSHYDVDDTHGFGSLGDAGGGDLAGVITQVEHGPGRTVEIVLYNPNTTPATVDLVGNYVRANLPNFTRRVSVPAGGTLVLNGVDLGMVANQPVGLSYSSDRTISVMATEVQNGDADGATAVTAVGTEWFFGDAFIGKKRAGEVYFETLSFYNPSASTIQISVELLYTNGFTDTLTINVGARDFGEIVLDENQTFLLNPNSTKAFSIRAFSASGFAVMLTHYDLLQGGGWANTGANLGLLNDLIAIE